MPPHPAGCPRKEKVCEIFKDTAHNLELSTQLTHILHMESATDYHQNPQSNSRPPDWETRSRRVCFHEVELKLCDNESGLHCESHENHQTRQSGAADTEPQTYPPPSQQQHTSPQFKRSGTHPLRQLPSLQLQSLPHHITVSRPRATNAIIILTSFFTFESGIRRNNTCICYTC
jgi:hypothetical protein